MLQVSILILLVFLAARLALWAAQTVQNRRGSGKGFRRMLTEGRIGSEVYDDAVWREVDRFGRRHLKVRISKRHRDKIRAARRALREDFLDDIRPGFYQYVIIFLIASVLGLAIETVWMLVQFGVFESRVGLVWGPFSPLYGVGAVLLTVVFWPLRKKPAYVIFPLAMLIGGGLEQLAGWSMEYFVGVQSWTYLNLPDHITQWVAWRFVFAWGLIGLVWCKAIMPELIFRIGEVTTTRQMAIVWALTAFMALDVFMTFACFMRADARRAGVPPSNPFEVYVDAHYDDDFIKGTFQNLTWSDEGPKEYA